MSTIRLTVGQAVVKFLNHQYVKFDGKKSVSSKVYLRFLDMEM